MKNPEDLKKPVSLFNPLAHDFEAEWLDDKNDPHKLVIPAIDIATFPHYQAQFMANRLTYEIMAERGYAKNTEIQRREIMQEILVKI